MYNYNPGVTGGYYEGNRMYELQEILASSLRKNGFDVVTTRKKVTDNPTVDARGKLARDTKCDIIMSLHTNAYGDGKTVKIPNAACGVETYRSVQDGAEQIKFANFINDTITNLINPDTGITYSRGVKTMLYPGDPSRDYFGVIRNATGVKYRMLIEYGFHTNMTECAWLNKQENLTRLADYQALQMAKYFDGTAGSIDAPTNTVNEIYRVRSSWDDPKSQIGAYTFLSNAQTLVDKTAGTFYVFDGKGNVVYPAVNNEGSSKPITIGGQVKVLRAYTYEGKPFKVYFDKYDVINKTSGRVVIGIGTTITAAVNETDLEAV